MYKSLLAQLFFLNIKAGFCKVCHIWCLGDCDLFLKVTGFRYVYNLACAITYLRDCYV